ncbi:cullin-1-like [Argentina anserina]|uniref:cullin-1-like n=1 Tax=Argentina anserina TaxID=57926 RepID=UPI0021764F24|nr:cullin-1-like [Potentilla anserina]XP_050382569.1 cullin-1-like [Potentilla anserina]
MQFIQLDEGLAIIDEAFRKARKIVEGYPETKFTTDEYMKFHACVYTLCYKPGDGNKVLLHEKFKGNLEETINSTVLPSLAAKENEALLREFVLMWSNYKLMVKWLCRFFEYLDRYYSSFCSGVSLGETSIDCFRSLVFNVLHGRIQAATMSLINEERYGKQIDPKLLQDVLSIFMEISKNRSLPYYENFVQAMLDESAAFYSHLSSQWVAYDSLTGYIEKVNWCMMQEKEKAGHYLDPTSVIKLLQVLHCQLLDMNALKLVEKLQAQSSSQLDYQEILSKCAGLSLGEESSASTLGEHLSALMAKSAHIH